MEAKLLYRIHVTGRVQGVGFRWSAAHEARRLGICGYVKNLSDGSVYLEAVGSKEQLEDFLGWCRKGTGIGFVRNVSVESMPPVNYLDFRIEH